MAEGKAELYYEAHLNCWDVLAGILIAEEAGAIVERPALADLLSRGGPVRACAPAMEATITDLFRQIEPAQDVRPLRERQG